VPLELVVPVIDWETPQLNESTSISFLCLESLLSPSIPSTFKNASNIAVTPSLFEVRGAVQLPLSLAAGGATRVPAFAPAEILVRPR
jgi:hypothetical protein